MSWPSTFIVCPHNYKKLVKKLAGKIAYPGLRVQRSGVQRLMQIRTAATVVSQRLYHEGRGELIILQHEICVVGSGFLRLGGNPEP
jgi:hypothetical protein